MSISTIRNMGVAGGIALMLLSTTVVFAKESKRGEVKKVEGGAKIGRTLEATSTDKIREEGDRAKVGKRVAEIKDKAKKNLASKLSDQFDHTNKVWTDQFTQLLDHYDALLVKAAVRANASSTAIESAKAAIMTARAAVAAQVAKTYAPDTSKITVAAPATTKGQGELMKGLKNSFQDLHKLLFKDLFAIRDGVMRDAKTAVQSVARLSGTKIDK